MLIQSFRGYLEPVKVSKLYINDGIACLQLIQFLYSRAGLPLGRIASELISEAIQTKITSVQRLAKKKK